MPHSSHGEKYNLIFVPRILKTVNIFLSHIFREGVEGSGCSSVTSEINRLYADLHRLGIQLPFVH